MADLKPPYLPEPPRGSSLALMNPIEVMRWFTEIWRRFVKTGTWLIGNLFIGTPTGYTQIEEDGTIVNYGTATTWRDFGGQMLSQNASPVIAVETTARTSSATGLTLAGSIGNTYLENGTYYQGTEQTGTPFTWDFTFRDNTKASDIVYLYLQYSAASAHNLKLQCYNNNTAAWVNVTAATTDFAASTSIVKYIFNLSGLSGWGSGYYFDASNDLQLRLNHSSNGNVAHVIYIDKYVIARERHVPRLTAVSTTGLRAMEFPGADSLPTYLSGSIEIDHSYKQGSNIYPHVHFMATTANAGNVKMYLEYSWVNATGTVSGSSTIYFTAAASGTAWKEQRCNFDNSNGTSAWSGLSGTNMTIGSRFLYALYRDPNDVADTYTDSILLYDFQLHEESDTIGSRQVTSK